MNVCRLPHFDSNQLLDVRLRFQRNIPPRRTTSPGRGGRAGIGLGCIAAGATQVTDGMMLEAARAVAAITSPADLRRDCVLPDASRLR